MVEGTTLPSLDSVLSLSFSITTPQPTGIICANIDDNNVIDDDDGDDDGDDGNDDDDDDGDDDGDDGNDDDDDDDNDDVVDDNDNDVYSYKLQKRVLKNLYHMFKYRPAKKA
jgi:hypothetical protein